MVEVPTDYVLSIMRQAIDGRIDALEQKLTINHTTVREDIMEVKVSVREFQTACNLNMKAMDERIKDYEQFKWKLVAFCGAVAVMASVAAKFIFG